MKKVILLLLSGMLLGGTCLAQNGYTISGKIRGISISKAFLVAADFGSADTLASTAVEGDKFMFSGTVPGGVRAVNLTFAGVEGQVPLLLENINYQISITAQGAAIEGEGPAVKLWKEFERIGHDYAIEKNRAELEYKALEGRGNAAEVERLQVRLDNAYKQSELKTQELIKANADHYISAYIIALNMLIDDEATLRAKYELLGPSARASVPGKAIAAMLNRYGKLVEGEVAPNFTLMKPDGNTFTLHGLPAKWKVLHFWAARQGSSRQDNSELVKFYLQYRPKGVEVISVSLDDNHAMWKQAIGLDGMIWTNGSDLKGMNSEITRLYLVKDIPAYVLLDAEKRIIARDLSFSDLRAKVAELTKKKRKK